MSSLNGRLLWRTRVRGWLFAIIFLSFMFGAVRYLYVAWRRSRDKKVPVVSRSRVSRGAPVLMTTPMPEYDFSNMVVLMAEYSRVVVEERPRRTLGKMYIQQLQNLLSDILDEREKYFEFLDRERRHPSSFETRKSKRASQHYLRSMENAIADLQRMLRERVAR